MSYIGMDLVETPRIGNKLSRPDFVTSVFTSGEIEYCQRQARPSEHFAARFSAKEAVAKALSLDGFDPLEIEVVGGGEKTRLRLRGDVSRRAAELSVEVRISMSHLAGVAGAVALAIPGCLLEGGAAPHGESGPTCRG